jgi:hypothetical protein
MKVGVLFSVTPPGQAHRYGYWEKLLVEKSPFHRRPELEDPGEELVDDGAAGAAVDSGLAAGMVADRTLVLDAELVVVAALTVAVAAGAVVGSAAGATLGSAVGAVVNSGLAVADWATPASIPEAARIAAAAREILGVRGRRGMRR